MATTQYYPAFSSNLSYTGVTAAPANARQNNTDTISISVKLYIEGVQIPFNTISISQVYNQLPVANVQIPPASGLMEIIRGYQPKVHIFYLDNNTGDYRLLFWGHLENTSYTKSRAGSGSSSISFSCTHKNAFLKKCTLDYAGWCNPQAENLANPASASSGTAVQPGAFNSQSMIITALAGIDDIAGTNDILSPSNPGVTNTTATNLLDPSLAPLLKRYYGMSGTIMNLWNQYKREGLAGATKFNAFVNNMWVPLVEQGLGFFKRLAGHYLLESRVQTEKIPYCHKPGQPDSEVCVPPIFRQSMLSAYNTETAVSYLNSQLSFSSEMYSFDGLFRDYLGACGYDILTLACPAQVPTDPELQISDTTRAGVDWQSVETVITPQLPIYYSPICNVLLPRMYHTLSISQNDTEVPTRLSAKHDALPPGIDTSGSGITYLGPPTIREAVAYNFLLNNQDLGKSLQLSDTKGYSYSLPGKYEFGSGARPEHIYLPWWLATIYADKASTGAEAGQEEIPAVNTQDYNEMMFLTVDWNTRYAVKTNFTTGNVDVDPTKYGLNPYSPNNIGVHPMDRMFFSAIDYEFSKRFLGARNGIVECVFNPYIIPGYPMDVIDDSPANPSFHGFCSSVNHTITTRGASTSVSISAAVSYAELSNYYIPPAPPFLQSALNLVNGTVNISDGYQSGDTSAFTNVSSTLIQNPQAKLTADIHYKQVLGVGAVAPDDLIHFASGRAYPMYRQNDVLYPRTSGGSVPDLVHKPLVNGRQPDDYYSTVGNLRLVSRQIESKPAIESNFQYTFIDLTATNYNNSFKNFINPNLTTARFLEPGASLFLDYLEIETLITP